MSYSNEVLDNKEKINNICNLILNKNFGETITTEELNQIICENLNDERGKRKFKKIMQKCKNRLIQNGFVIRSIYNVGYYILEPRQIASYTYRNYMLKPLKSFDKAKIILEKTNKKELSTRELENHKLTIALNNSLIYATNELLNDNDYKELLNERGE